MPTSRGKPMRRREIRSTVAEKKRKLSALAELQRQRIDEEAAPAPIVAVADAETGKSRGRPSVGKRSNPDWKLYSHFLKRQTQRAAVARLQAEDRDSDLSDVLQNLLEAWLKT
jgi:hypothetical protein